MTNRLGDRQWLELLRDHNGIVRQNLASYGGYEVKSQGDGFMVVFSSARSGLDCAVGMQRDFSEFNARRGGDDVRVRMGVHVGEALRDGDDFYGNSVNLAARIAADAQGGGISASPIVKELTESSGEFLFGEGRMVEFKGFPGQHQVFDVRWQDEVSEFIGAESQRYGQISDYAGVGVTSREVFDI